MFAEAAKMVEWEWYDRVTRLPDSRLPPANSVLCHVLIPLHTKSLRSNLIRPAHICLSMILPWYIKHIRMVSIYSDRDSQAVVKKGI